MGHSNKKAVRKRRCYESIHESTSFRFIHVIAHTSKSVVVFTCSGLPADLENLEKPGISLCHLGNLENQGKFFENLENIFFDLEFPF